MGILRRIEGTLDRPVVRQTDLQPSIIVVLRAFAAGYIVMEEAPALIEGRAPGVYVLLHGAVPLTEPWVTQPFQNPRRPWGNRARIAGAYSEAVTHSVVDMQLSVRTGPPQCQIQFGEALRDRRLVRSAAEEKCRWRVRRELHAPLRYGRIEQGLKTWPGAHSLDRVAGVRHTAVSGRHPSERSKLAARGETHDAHLIRVQTPFRGSATYYSDGTLHIGESVALDRVRRPRRMRQPVFQNKRRHS